MSEKKSGKSGKGGAALVVLGIILLVLAIGAGVLIAYPGSKVMELLEQWIPLNLTNSIVLPVTAAVLSVLGLIGLITGLCLLSRAKKSAGAAEVAETAPAEPAKEEPEAAAEEPVKEEPEAVAEEPVKEEPEAAAEEPVKEEPEAVAEEPVKEEPEAASEEPVKEEPEAAAEEPVKEEPEAVAEEPDKEEPEAAAEEPAKEEPEAAAEEPVKEEPEAAAEEPVKEEPEAVAEEPVKEEPEAVAEEPVKEEPAEKAEKADRFAGLPVEVEYVEGEVPEGSDGYLFTPRYKKSFVAKMALGTDAARTYYAQIKHKALSYDRVRSRISWNFDRFNLGRQTILKMTVRGKTLCCYFAADPAQMPEKYYTRDVSDVKKFQNTPVMLPVRSARAAKYACEILEGILKAENAEFTGEHTEDVETEVRARTLEQLIDEGEVIELLSEEDYEARSQLRGRLFPGQALRTSVKAEEVDDILTDDEAKILLENKKVSRIDRSRRAIVNVDQLSDAFEDGDTVTPDCMKEKKLIPEKTTYVKVLARGTLNKRLIVEANDFSLGAVKMITVLGGEPVRLINFDD